MTTKTLRRRVLAGRITRSARRLTLHLPRRWPWEEQFSRALARLRAIPHQLNVPANSRQPHASCRVLSRHLALHSHCRPPSVADPANLPSTQISSRL